MELSIIIAKISGICLTAIGVSMLFNKGRYQEMLKELGKSMPLQNLATIMPLVLGSIIVTIHNTWVNNWTVLITLMGWLFLIVGVIRIIFPSFWINKVKNHHEQIPLFLISLIVIIVGLIFLYLGFM